MKTPVPADDLPANAVPADDLPQLAATVAARAAPAKRDALDVRPFRVTGEGGWLDEGAYKAGGLVTDLASNVLPPEGAAAAGFATNVAIQAVPAFLGGEAAKAAAPALQHGARSLMQSALKPTYEQLRTGKAAQAINTMLEQGFNASPGGVRAMRTKIGELNQEIMRAIQNSPASVDKVAVGSRLQDTLRKFQNQVNPQADTEAIYKAWQEFFNHPLLVGQRQMPVQTAQQLKQGTYKALGEKSYGELKGAEIEAQKALARGLKEEIAAAVPAVGPANAAESELLNALNVLERRVLMDANKNPIGLGALNLDNVLLWMADRSPFFKSLIARFLNAGAEQIPATAGRAAGAAAGMAVGGGNKD